MIDFNRSIVQLENNDFIFENLIHSISREQANWKPDEDRWSVLEILNHLIDIEIEDFRYSLDLILFNPEKEWPSFNEIEWITSRQYNERELKSSMRNFIRERDLSLIWLNKMSNPDLDSKLIGDGINKKNISAGDLLASWMGHDLFHMKQIILLKWDILKKWSEPFSPEYSGFYD